MIYLFNNQEELIKIINSPSIKVLNQTETLTDEHLLDDRITAEVNALEEDLLQEIEYMAVKKQDADYQYSLYYIISATTEGNNTELYGVTAGFEELDKTIIEDKRPRNVIPRVAIDVALENTNWTAGFVGDVPNNSSHFYYISSLEAIKKICQSWGLEAEFVIEMNGARIGARYINFYTQLGKNEGKRVVYGHNALKILQESERTGIYTALIGRGKGEMVSDGTESESGQAGYGRRILFDEIEWSVTNGDPINKPLGQKYVELPEATATYGIKTPQGNRPKVGVVEFQEEEDPVNLLKLTYQYLMETSRPLATFETTPVYLDADIGDVIRVVRYDRHLDYKTRAFQVVTNRLTNTKINVKLGDQLTQSPGRQRANLANQIGAIADDRVDQILDYLPSATGKNTNFYGDAEPENPKVNDIWWKPNPEGEDKPRWIMRWTGEVWERLDVTSEAIEQQFEEVDRIQQELIEDVEASENKAQQAIEDAGVAQATADGAYTYAQNILDNLDEEVSSLLMSETTQTSEYFSQVYLKSELLDGKLTEVLMSGTSQTAQYIQDYVIGEDYLSEVIQTSNLIQSEIRNIVPVPTEAEITAIAEATNLSKSDIETMFASGFINDADLQTIADMAGISLEEAQTLVGNILDAEMVQQYETVERLAELYRLEDRRTLTAGTTFKYTLTTLPFDIESGKEYVVEFEYPTTTYDSYFYLYTGDLTLQITGNHNFQDPDGQIKITFNAGRNLPAGDEIAIAFIDGRGVEQLWVENISFSGMKEMQVPIVSENNGTIANRITQTADAIDMGLFGQEGAISRIYAGEKGLYLKGENIHLDGKVSMEDAFVRTLVSSDITTDTISAVSGTFTNLISTNIDARSITTQTLNALRARIMGAYTYVDISGTGIGINRYDGNRSIELNTVGMDIYRGNGVVAGRVGGANDVSNVYSGIVHIGAERGNAVALSSKVNGSNAEWVRSIWVDGTTGDIKTGVPIMAGETGYGIKLESFIIDDVRGIGIIMAGLTSSQRTGIWYGNGQVKIGTRNTWRTIHSYGNSQWT